jgi:hypothetical protein
MNGVIWRSVHRSSLELSGGVTVGTRPSIRFDEVRHNRRQYSIGIADSPRTAGSDGALRGTGDWKHEGRWQHTTGTQADQPVLRVGRTADYWCARLELRVLGMALGSKHSCAVLSGGRLKCWGASGAGQLGLEDWRDRGDQHEHMGDALPLVDLGSQRSVLALSSHALRTCALLDDETVKCWGGGREEPGRAPGTMGDALPPIDL